MEIVLSIGLGAGILMLFVLIFKQQKKHEDYYFLFWILAVLLQICFYQITLFQYPLEGFFAIAGFALPLLSAPLLFLYITHLVGKPIKVTQILLHLSTYVLYVAFFLTVHSISKGTIIAEKGYLLMEATPFWMPYYAIPLAISGFVYTLWTWILLKEHQKNIPHLFSFEEKVHLKWVEYIVYSFVALFIIASFLIFGATQFGLFPIYFAFAFVGIALGLILVSFGFYGFRQTAVFTNNHLSFAQQKVLVEDIKPLHTSYSKSGLSADDIEKHASKLTAFMKLKKPYLKEDLTLISLSAMYDLSHTQLSQIINQHFGVNFYDFINQYRIEEAKQMLSSSKFDHLSILGIAFDCGFKSKSSFNRYFKKYLGTTPSEFKRNI